MLLIDAAPSQSLFDPSVARDAASFLDASSRAAIDFVVSQFQPPAAISGYLLPPPGQRSQFPQNGISIGALNALASCTGAQQQPAQEFLSKYQGLWQVVGSEFVSHDHFRQLLIQVEPPTARCTLLHAHTEQAAPSFHLSSHHSKAAVKSFLLSKLSHAKATFDEHLHLKFVAGKRYLCEVPESDFGFVSDSMASGQPRTTQCVLLRHLDDEYEVEIVGPDHIRTTMRVKTLREIPAEPVDDCDWSDEAYSRDCPSVLAAIAAHFPGFHMSNCVPTPQRRTHWPINFFYPNSRTVRSSMDFDEVDYGIRFTPFLSEIMLPSLTGERREWLMATVRRLLGVFLPGESAVIHAFVFCRQ